MRQRKFGIISRTWEEVTEPVFKKALEYFPKYIISDARKYARMIHKKYDGPRNAMAISGIYIALLESDIILSQTNICIMFDTSAVTLRKWFDRLCNMLDKQKVRKLKRRIKDIGYLTTAPKGAWRRGPYYEIQFTKSTEEGKC